MIRPKLVVVNNDRDDQPRSFQDEKRYLFDMSGKRLMFYSLTFVLSLCFMFTLGIFVGRGSPVVRSDDFSIKGRFLRLLGLEAQGGRSSAGAALSWEDPAKMLESLDYYEKLTHKGGTAMAAAPKPVDPPVPPAPEPAKEAKRAPGSSRQTVEKPSAVQPEKPQQPPGVAGQRFTLLVASLKESEAKALIERLKARGSTRFRV